MICPKCKSEMIKGRKSWMCEDCGTKVDFAESYSAEEQLVINHYPIFIAAPYKMMLDKSDYGARLRLLIDVFTNILKYLALIVETEYLNSAINDEKVNEVILDDLSRPLVSSWLKFLKLTIPALSNNGHKYFVPEIPLLYDQIEAKIKKKDQFTINKGYYNEDGELVATKGKLGLLSALISYRNSYSHGFNPPDQKSKSDFSIYYPLLQKILETMEFTSRYPIFKLKANLPWLLMGVKSTPAEFEVDQNAFNNRPIALYDTVNKRILPIIPFIVAPENYIKNSDGVEVLIYDKKNDRCIYYYGENGHEKGVESTIAHWNTLIERKTKLKQLAASDITGEALCARLRLVTNATFKFYKGIGKYIPEVFTPREALALPFTLFNRSELKGMIIAGESGSGKTTLFCSEADKLAKSGAELLFVRAADFHCGNFNDSICRILGLAPDIPLNNAIKTAGIQTLFVFIDGINEHPLGRELAESINDALVDGPLKIAMTVRSDALSGIYPDGVKEMIHTEKYVSAEGPGKESDWCIRVMPLSKPEIDQMYSCYTRYKSSDGSSIFKPKIKISEIAVNKTLYNAMTNPLILRLFCEVFHGRKMTRPVSAREILSMKLAQIDSANKESGITEFLLALAGVYYREKASRLTIDLLCGDPVVGPGILSSEIGSPYRILKRAGILYEYRETPLETCVGWSYDLLFENMLGRYLTQSITGNSDLLAVSQETEQFTPLYGGLAVYHSDKIKQEGLTSLIWYTSHSGSEGGRICGEVLIDLDRNGYDMNVALTDLLNNPSENDIRGVEKLCDYYTENLRYQDIESIINPAADQAHDSELRNKTGDLLNRVGNNCVITGNYTEALKYHEKTLEIREKIYGSDHPDVATSYNSIGNTYKGLGEYEQALDFYKKALKIRQKVYGSKHSDVAGSYNNIGVTCYELGEYTKTLKYFEKALKIYLQVYGNEHPDVAMSYNNIGVNYNSLGEYSKTLEYYEKALEIRLKVYGSKHPDVAMSYNNFGVTCHDLGEYTKTLVYYEKALDIYLQVYGKEHPLVTMSYSNIGVTCYELGEYAKALEYHEKSLEIYLKVYGTKHPKVAMNYNNIGVALYDLKEYAKALEYYEKALKIYLKIHGNEHPDVASSYNYIGVTCYELGEYTKALKYFENALKIRQKVYGNEHPDVAASCNYIGWACEKLGDMGKAALYLKKAEKEI